MQKICLILIDSDRFDYASAFRQAFQRLEVDAEIIRIEGSPNHWTADLAAIKSLIRKKQKNHFVIFFPGPAEFFLRDPDWSFVCSHYRSWYDPKRMTVIPHIWTYHDSVAPNSYLEWSEKPPLAIGFMGSAYSNSRIVRVISRLPRFAKKWLLKGYYLRWIELVTDSYRHGVSVKHINTFPRVETLRALEAGKNGCNGTLEIVDTNGFTGRDHDKARYQDHLARMTYVICPRGIENFSFRVYEALQYGRVPVIIDTDMVLPKEINWDEISLVIPYDRINQIYAMILQDYHSLSAAEFMSRQRAAFSTFEKLRSMEWLRRGLIEAITASALEGDT